MEARWLPNTGANQALIVILFFIRPILRERERKGAQTRVQTVNLWFIREEGRKKFWQRLIFTKCYLKAIALSLFYRRGDEGT